MRVCSSNTSTDPVAHFAPCAHDEYVPPYCNETYAAFLGTPYIIASIFFGVAASLMLSLHSWRFLLMYTSWRRQKQLVRQRVRLGVPPAMQLQRHSFFAPPQQISFFSVMLSLLVLVGVIDYRSLRGILPSWLDHLRMNACSACSMSILITILLSWVMIFEHVWRNHEHRSRSCWGLFMVLHLITWCIYVGGTFASFEVGGFGADRTAENMTIAGAKLLAAGVVMLLVAGITLVFLRRIYNIIAMSSLEKRHEKMVRLRRMSCAAMTVVFAAVVYSGYFGFTSLGQGVCIALPPSSMGELMGTYSFPTYIHLAVLLFVFGLIRPPAGEMHASQGFACRRFLNRCEWCLWCSESDHRFLRSFATGDDLPGSGSGQSTYGAADPGQPFLGSSSSSLEYGALGPPGAGDGDPDCLTIPADSELTEDGSLGNSVRLSSDPSEKSSIRSLGADSFGSSRSHVSLQRGVLTSSITNTPVDGMGSHLPHWETST